MSNVEKTKPAKAKAPSGGAVSVKGKTIVLTGTVPGMQRKDVEAKLDKLGARCTGSVSKRTDYVFAMADAGSKKAEAARLGVAVLGEAELFALIGTPRLAPPKPAAPVSKAAKAKVSARKPDAGGGFAGKTVVVTGTMSKPRADIEKRLRKVGAKVTGSVSASTQYLITGADVGATKLAKAKALGVTVIDEAKMTAMLGS